jgi:hypothetical protein
MFYIFILVAHAAAISVELLFFNSCIIVTSTALNSGVHGKDGGAGKYYSTVHVHLTIRQYW